MSAERIQNPQADKQGRPLRERKHRNFASAPFKGGVGGEHPRAQRLRARQEAFDALRSDQGRKRPGSLKK